MSIGSGPGTERRGRPIAARIVQRSGGAAYFVVSGIDGRTSQLINDDRTTNLLRSNFIWPEDSGSAKDMVVTIANRIMKQRPECLAIDTENLVLNGSEKTAIFALPV